MTQAASRSVLPTAANARALPPRPRAQDPVRGRAGAQVFLEDEESDRDEGLDDRRLRLAILIGGAGSLVRASERP